MLKFVVRIQIEFCEKDKRIFTYMQKYEIFVSPGFCHNVYLDKELKNDEEKEHSPVVEIIIQ